MPQMFEPNFAVNSRVFEIAAEGELANILSHFNSEYIYSSLKTNIAQRMNRHSNVIQMPNFVAAIEQDFTQLKSQYPGEGAEIMQTRIETYKNIIDILCKEYDLTFKDDGNIDYYGAAFCLYDFLVCNFDTYVINFYTTFIIQEANTLYDMMSLGTIKKNKDTSSMYAKKMYEDPKLAAIASNLASVLYQMSGMDIPFYTILSYSVIDPAKHFLYYIVSPNGDFFKDIYSKYILNDATLPLNVTNIRLELQKRCGAQTPVGVPTQADFEDNSDSAEENINSIEGENV